PVSRRLRVLVIDDDPLVLSVVERLLKGGHEVVSFGSARAGLARLQQDQAFDVILCDVMMPDMTGMQFHQALTRLSAPLASRMLVLTGAAFASEAREFLHRNPTPCVSKPFTREELCGAIAAVARSSEARARPSGPRA